MSIAIVLSGGGSRGAYQIGVWKALKKLGIKYNIVTGTSVGALNGVLMVQDDLEKGVILWKNLDYSKIYNNNFKNNITSYLDVLTSGGMEVNGLQKLIDDTININKFYKSKINYGLVTVDFTNLKVLQLTKKEIPKNLLKDYVLASASCYPVFKKKKIGDNLYIDGGYSDNLPINLAIKLGAKKIIAVDLNNNYDKEKYKTNIPITLIKPNNKLKFFLNFDKKYSIQAINFGYNDTLKKFNKLDGNIYSFRKNEIIKIKKLYFEKMVNKLKSVFSNTKEIKVNKNYKTFISGNNFLEIIENCGKIFELEESKIYTYKEFNKLLINNLKNSKVNIKLDSPIYKLEKNIGSKNLVLYIYNELKKSSNNITLLYSIFVFFPNTFLSALYLSVIN